MSSPTLLCPDEEADAGIYRVYLRAQTDGDLLDIARHLDPERYPARRDAAGRELRRRGLLQMRVYSPAESAIRFLALGALLLAGVTVALALWLSPADAASPSWPTGEMLPDGMPMCEVMRLFTVAVLRGVVVWSAHLALFPLLLLALTGRVGAGLWPVRCRRARADVWALAGLGAVALVGAVFWTTQSAIPQIFAVPADAPTLQAVQPLLDPFASYHFANET